MIMRPATAMVARPDQTHPQGVPATSTAEPRAGGRTALAAPHCHRDGPACGSLNGGKLNAQKKNEGQPGKPDWPSLRNVTAPPTADRPA